MRRDELVSVSAFVLLAVLLLLGIHEGLWSLNEVLSLVPYFIIAGMVGVVIWGFRQRIENAMKATPSGIEPSDQREQAARPIINIYDPNVTAQPLQIRYKHRFTTVDARLLVLKVGSLRNAAFKLKVAGATTPEMSEDALVSFGWLLRRSRFIDEIPVTVPVTENDAIAEISASIAENVLQSDCDLPAEIAHPVVVGFILKDSSTLCFGDCLIDLPYEGRVHVTAYNETYGVLVERWFKLDARSWDKIDFTWEP